MSRIFYDRIIIMEEVEKEIGSLSQSAEEKDELWQIVDEMIHHRVLGFLLDKLPEHTHQEFLDKFSQAPQDESLFDYLKEKISENIEELIQQEIGSLAVEILKEIRAEKKNQQHG